VLVALSGGPDSVALLHVLRTLERRGELAVAAAAHFNHQLRGAEADEDQSVVQSADEERSDHGAEHRAFAAFERGTADDGG